MKLEFSGDAKPRRPGTFAKALLGMLLVAALGLTAHDSIAAEAAKSSAAELNRKSFDALHILTSKVSAANALNAKAHAVLVFPSIVKAGLMVGGQYGEGALIKGGKPVAYYSTGGVSVGLQAGYQDYGYALFLMTPKAVAALDHANGFEIGVGPSVVVVDEGMGKNTTTTTMKEDIYALIFSQKGVMLALGIQGNKISRIEAK